MLSKNHRINKELFKKIFKDGIVFHSKFVFLKTNPTKEENTRFTVVVPVKTAKKAINRNKIKRRARYIVEKLLPLFKKSTVNVVFIKKGGEKLSFKELEKEITFIFQKAKIL